MLEVVVAEVDHKDGAGGQTSRDRVTSIADDLYS